MSGGRFSFKIAFLRFLLASHQFSVYTRTPCRVLLKYDGKFEAHHAGIPATLAIGEIQSYATLECASCVGHALFKLAV